MRREVIDRLIQLQRVVIANVVARDVAGKDSTQRPTGDGVDQTQEQVKREKAAGGVEGPLMDDPWSQVRRTDHHQQARCAENRQRQSDEDTVQLLSGVVTSDGGEMKPPRGDDVQRRLDQPDDVARAQDHPVDKAAPCAGLRNPPRPLINPPSSPPPSPAPMNERSFIRRECSQIPRDPSCSTSN